MPGAISTPHILFYFRDETMKSVSDRWDEWVRRDATVVTRKDQSEDTAGVQYELLRSRIIVRPALIDTVVIAEPVLNREQSTGHTLMFYPFTPWKLPTIWFATIHGDDDPDTIWLAPRNFTAEEL